LGRRAGSVFTVARWAAHPHNPETSSAKANFVTNRNFLFSDELGNVIQDVELRPQSNQPTTLSAMGTIGGCRRLS
jgi:hypothetical protein